MFFGVVVFATATTAAAAADGVVVDDHDYGDASQQMSLFITEMCNFTLYYDAQFLLSLLFSSFINWATHGKR